MGWTLSRSKPMPTTLPIDAHCHRTASLASICSLATDGSSASMINERYRGLAGAFDTRRIPRNSQSAFLLSKSLAFVVIGICILLLSYSIYANVYSRAVSGVVKQDGADSGAGSTNLTRDSTSMTKPLENSESVIEQDQSDTASVSRPIRDASPRVTPPSIPIDADSTDVFKQLENSDPVVVQDQTDTASLSRPIGDASWITPIVIPPSIPIDADSAQVSKPLDNSEPVVVQDPSDTAPVVPTDPIQEQDSVETPVTERHQSLDERGQASSAQPIARPIGLCKKEGELSRQLDLCLQQTELLWKQFTESLLREHMNSNRRFVIAWTPVCQRYPCLNRKFELVGEQFAYVLGMFYKEIENDVWALQKMRREKGRATPEELHSLQQMIPKYAWYEKFLQERPKYYLWKRIRTEAGLESDSDWSPDLRYTLQMLEFPGKQMFAI